MKIENIAIDKIEIGERYRRDYGDLEDLAQSIRQVGLLHPIVINEKNKLICGERRLRAFQILGRTSIPCQILDVSVLAGEFSENVYRQPFSPTERLAIAEAVEREMGNRAGRPSKENVPNRAQFEPGLKTREMAAKKAGFTSKNQLERVATVVELGAPETVKAMDEGRLSISAAADIAKAVPREKQTAVLAMPKEELKQAVRDAREALEAKRRSDEQIMVGIFHTKVKEIAQFYMEGEQFWEVNSRRYADELPSDIDRALNTLNRLKEAHPNASRRPRKIL